MKVGAKNQLTEENIQTILGCYSARKEVLHRAALVERERIEDAKYRLSVSTWVEPEDTREKVDIKALNAEIAEIVARENELRTEVDTIVAELEADFAEGDDAE